MEDQVLLSALKTVSRSASPSELFPARSLRDIDFSIEESRKSSLASSMVSRRH